MANNDKNRQKKLAKKKAKRKAKAASQRAASPSSPMAAYLRDGRHGRIVSCTVSLHEGVASILLARSAAVDIVAVAAFCVDLYCLGVKDSFLRVWSSADLDEAVERQDRETIAPADAKKMIEGAVEYAAKYGFDPMGDYGKAMRYFHDVDSSQSTAEYEYGKDGKPLFVCGPFDSPEKCEAVINSLRAKCGEGNYHFIAPLCDWDEENGEWESNREMFE